VNLGTSDLTPPNTQESWKNLLTEDVQELAREKKTEHLAAKEAEKGRRLLLIVRAQRERAPAVVGSGGHVPRASIAHQRLSCPS